jgi:hypothetical protein
LKALDHLSSLVRKDNALLISAVPVWIHLLDPALITAAHPSDMAGDPNVFEIRAARCLIALGAENPSSTPLLHLDADSLALVVEATPRLFAWLEYFIGACLDHPSKSRAALFWPVIHRTFKLLVDGHFRQEDVLRIVMPVWVAEARQQRVRQAEVALGLSGQYIAGTCLNKLLDLAQEGGSKSMACWVRVGHDLVRAAYLHVRVLALEEFTPPGLAHILQALATPCLMLRTPKLRTLPGFVDDKFIAAVIRVYEFVVLGSARLPTHIAKRYQDFTAEVVTQCLQYLLFVFHSEHAFRWIQCAINEGMLSALFQTTPWVTQHDFPATLHAGDNPVAYMFEEIILGHMFIWPIFRAVMNSLQADRQSNTLPITETRQWVDRILFRATRWRALGVQALDMDKAVSEGLRHCHYSKVCVSALRSAAGRA